MASTAFETRQTGDRPDAIAPDGSEVRLLCATAHGSMAGFRLPPGAIARAVAHRTVEEIWHVIAGRGRIWRRSEHGREEITEFASGLSLTIPTGTRFQFRCDGEAPLEIVAVSMPLWPGDGEAYFVEGVWPATV